MELVIGLLIILLVLFAAGYFFRKKYTLKLTVWNHGKLKF